MNAIKDSTLAKHWIEGDTTEDVIILTSGFTLFSPFVFIISE